MVASADFMSEELSTRVSIGEFLSSLGVRVPVITTVLSSVFQRASRLSCSSGTLSAPAPAIPRANANADMVFLMIPVDYMN